MHSQKKIGAISTIRKPGAEFTNNSSAMHGNANLNVAGGNASHMTNKNYKYMSPYSKNIYKKGTFEV
jgi:hypothetical protein